MNPLYYLGAFALALGVLIVVHELGHYALAKQCGVKVLRFSVGFGKPLWARRYGSDGTEWALGRFPLGGYVKMLDEREAPVSTHELGRAFNRQSVGRRFAIVAAGPIANFVLAIVLYWVLFMSGSEELRPWLGSAIPGSPAAVAGVQQGELVRSVDEVPVLSVQALRIELLDRAFKGGVIVLETLNEKGEINFRKLDLGGLQTEGLEADVMQKLGLALFVPRLPAVIGAVSPDSAAAQAGLLAGDRVLALNGRPVDDWDALVKTIRVLPGQMLTVRFERRGAKQDITVRVPAVEERGETIGRIGVAARQDPAVRDKMMVTVQHAPLDALVQALAQTADMAGFTFSSIGRMVTGQLSWRNLSGPVTIADYAGQSARMGLSSYLKFLALISISLGVLNLLPIPLLDGGHLMYYTVEFIKGGPLSERVMEIGQQIGLALLLMLMAFAFYNDINRLVSG